MTQSILPHFVDWIAWHIKIKELLISCDDLEQAKVCFKSSLIWLYILMKYTAKGQNASNVLVKLKAIQIQSHYEKVKINK